MSDTLTVYEKCKHGQLERHPLGWLSPELIEPDFEQVETDLMGGVLCWCPGSREIVLEPTNYGLGYPDNLFIAHGLEVER